MLMTFAVMAALACDPGILIRETRVVPGMTQAQVEKVLGNRPRTFFFNGSPREGSITDYYPDIKLMVRFGPDGKVEMVRNTK